MNTKKFIAGSIAVLGVLLSYVGGRIGAKNNSLRISLAFGEDDKDEERRFLEIYKTNIPRFRNMRIDVRNNIGYGHDKTTYSFNIDKGYLWLLDNFIINF